MTDSMRGSHPESADLQRIADGEADVARDAALLSHLESCADCRAEIDRIQRVTAALTLSSRPPSSLSARIEARRAAARTSSSGTVFPAGNRARRFLLPVGLAAAAVLVLLVGRNEGPPASAEKGIPKAWPDVPISVTRSLFHGVMSDWSPATLDSAMAAAEGDSNSSIQLRYDGSRADSSSGRDLAGRAVTYLTSRGVKPERTRVLRTLTLWALREPVPAGAVQVLVVTTTPRLRPDSAQRQP